MLDRVKSYSNIGRIQTEGEAIGIDQLLVNYLNENNQPYEVATGDAQGIEDITVRLLEILK
jgi:hypothetical protein